MEVAEKPACMYIDAAAKSQLTVRFFSTAGRALEVTACLAIGKDSQCVVNQSSGVLYVESTAQGQYEFCAFNEGFQKNGMTTVSVHVELQEPAPAETEREDASVQSQLNELVGAVLKVQKTQRMTQQVQARLTTIFGQLQSTVTMWTLVKFLAVGGCAVLQVAAFRSFFARKRTAV